MVLNILAEEFTIDGVKNIYLLEKDRLESFKIWPFPDNTSCSVKKMAEAGFYWTGNEREKDTVACFVCDKSLDGWEETDDPWSEHTKHAPQCAFVKLGKPEKDYTVEEFLDLFGNVVKGHLNKVANKLKKRIKNYAETQMDAFLKSR